MGQLQKQNHAGFHLYKVNQIVKRLEVKKIQSWLLGARKGSKQGIANQEV